MRHVCLLVAALALWLPLAANAAAPAAGALGNVAPSQAIARAAVHCGEHAHYVRGHRNKAGHYVKGRCVRNRR